MALRAAGFETIMLNCNPETVSTDYDTSDRLYFEPLTPEDLANVIEAEQAASHGRGRLVGVIVSLGGQTPLKLAAGIDEDLVLGTSPASIDLAEDRERWNELCGRLGIPQPPGGTATTPAEAVAVAGRVGYPVLVRPSYVLGGRAMEIVYDDERLVEAVEAMSGVGGSLGREGGVTADRPVLVDRFLEDAVEVDVDAVRDATGEVVICGVMEHVEEAGVHSGDSACALPPQTLAAVVIGRARAPRPGHLRGAAGARAVQRPVRREGRPGLRAGGQPAGQPDRPLRGQGHRGAGGHGGGPGDGRGHPGRAARRGPAGRAGGRPRVGQGGGLPFNRFPGVDTLLGPEMRSTGEVMGIGATFGLAFAKSQIAAGNRLPTRGTVFFSLADRDKAAGLEAARQFAALGFDLAATSGTAALLEPRGIAVGTVVAKVGESHPGKVDAVELIAGGKVQLVVNTPRGRGPRADGLHIRATATGPPGAVPHHRGRGQGRGGRHRRLAGPPAVGPLAAGVPRAMSR